MSCGIHDEAGRCRPGTIGIIIGDIIIIPLGIIMSRRMDIDAMFGIACIACIPCIVGIVPVIGEGMDENEYAMAPDAAGYGMKDWGVIAAAAMVAGRGMPMPGAAIPLGRIT